MALSLSNEAYVAWKQPHLVLQFMLTTEQLLFLQSEIDV